MEGHHQRVAALRAGVLLRQRATLADQLEHPPQPAGMTASLPRHRHPSQDQPPGSQLRWPGAPGRILMHDTPTSATATYTVLYTGYGSPRVAATVGYLQDGDRRVVTDPGMVPHPSVILNPLGELGVAPEQVTDVVFSHHHPDHTLNAALFPEARFHDFQATYQHDAWLDREFTDDVSHLSSSVRLLLTPGHTPQDVSTIVETHEGLIVCTHLWWHEHGPAEDPFAPDREVLRASRE